MNAQSLKHVHTKFCKAMFESFRDPAADGGTEGGTEGGREGRTDGRVTGHRHLPIVVPS